MPPLLLAVSEGDLHQVQGLLDSGEDPLVTSPSGWTVLHAAAMTGDRAMVQLLLKNEAAAELVSAVTLWGCTPLYSAAASSQEEVMDCLLRAGPRLLAADLVQWSQAAKDTLILTACLWNPDNLKVLHSIGADINAKDREGYSVLQLAAIAGKVEAVKQLLALGASVHTISTAASTTAMLSAAARGHLAVTKLLVEAKAATDARDLSGDSALHLAAVKGHTAIVKYLLDMGVDVEARDSYGLRALHMAAVRGCEEVMGLLLDAGAEVDARDDDGGTACMFAAERGHCHVLKQLLAQGADPKMVTNQGMCALNMAIVEGHLHVVEAMLPLRSTCGSTRCDRIALGIAAGRGWEHVVKELIAQGTTSERALQEAALEAGRKGFMSLWGYLVVELIERYPEFVLYHDFGLIGAKHLKGLSDHVTKVAYHRAQEEVRKEREGLHHNTQYLVVQAAGMLKQVEGEKKAAGPGSRNGAGRHRVLRSWVLLPALLVAGTLGCLRRRS